MSSGLATASERCALEDLVPRISASALALADALAAAVAWEDYEQEVLQADDRSASIPMKLRHNTVVAQRSLGSDFLLVRLPSGAFYGFRDVARVDGKDVAERGERIQKLFLDGGKDPNETRALLDESARFNIGEIVRNLNLPTLILPLLLPDDSGGIGRLELELLDDDAGDDGRTCEVSFREKEAPYLVGTPEGRELPLRGVLRVARESGRIERVSILAGRPAIEHIELEVELAPFDDWELPLPATMTEVYARRSGPLVTRCKARYSNYRRFRVDATSSWKIPK